MDLSKVSVSVIIPVYNVENYLERCTKSVTSQTFFNIEILLIDDGSTDSSGALCDALAYEDERIKVYHQANQGLSAARNTGILRAKGTYIAFLDSDDYWDVAVGLEEMVAVLTKQPNDIDVLLYSYSKVDLRTETKTNRIIKGQHPSGEYGFKEKMALLQRGEYFNAAWCKLLRRDFVIKNNLFFPVGVKSEDLVWSRQVLAKAKTICVYSIPLLVYQTYRPGSIVNSFNQKNYEDILKQFRDEAAFFKTCSEETRTIGCAYWAEQATWFLAYLPKSGKSLKQTVLECETVFEMLPFGVSKRAKIVNAAISIFGKMLTVKLLEIYLQLKSN